MTTPEPKDYGVPAGAMRPGDLGKLQNINGDSINWGQLTGITAAAEEARNGFLQGLRSMVMKPLLDIFSGKKPKGWEDVSAAFQDGQLKLTSRVDLLDGLRGYCSAYQSLNITSRGSSGSERVRRLPFDKQIGPHKGAHIDRVRQGIVLDEPGAWLVFVQAKCDQTGWLPGPGETDGSSVTLRVYTPDGQEFSKHTTASVSGKFEDSLVIIRTVVVPEPGYWIDVKCWSSRWRWWLGGTEFSALTVVKQDSRLDNSGEVTVPNEDAVIPEPTNPDTEVEP
ncbi:hypothetical protein [Corynebacterium sp. c8Ua_99]|uniref:hypothetical protein n=1 Tax=Corynebacterium sp. c8Ua_99 TaxID=3032335 RepID=UPI003265AD87